MIDLSRRKFLIASAGLGAAGLASGAMGITWPDLMREAKGDRCPRAAAY